MNFIKKEFWKAIPIWKDVDYNTFVSTKWQEKNAVSS